MSCVTVSYITVRYALRIACIVKMLPNDIHIVTLQSARGTSFIQYIFITLDFHKYNHVNLKPFS